MQHRWIESWPHPGTFVLCELEHKATGLSTSYHPWQPIRATAPSSAPSGRSGHRAVRASARLRSTSGEGPISHPLARG